jgi:hypothetical protein
LIKGVFVLLVLIGGVLWLLLNPLREREQPHRPWIAFGIAVAAMIGAAIGYDAWYASVTGDTFWRPYWARQLGPVTIASPLEDAAGFARNFLFYLSRLLWHPAPWSFALLLAWWRSRAARPAASSDADRRTRSAVLFALAFALLSILVLAPSSRFAERYAFSATYAVAAAGAVAAYRVWPAVRRTATQLDERVPAAPAVLWLTLMLLRMVSGPILPRL